MKMIKECNFKAKDISIELVSRVDYDICALVSDKWRCPGEDNCILYQIYKSLQPDKPKLPKEPPIDTIDSRLRKTKPREWSTTIKKRKKDE